jgi:hypothetical protein
MTPMTEPAAAMTHVGARWRTILTWVLVVLTSIAILTSAVGVWAHRTLLNTDSWVATVGPLAKDPAVTDAVATEVSNQLIPVLDLEHRITDRLPSSLDGIAPGLATAANQFILNAIKQLMRTDQFHTFWVEANRRAHAAAVRVLRGDTKLVSTKNGEVTLNFLPLIADALQKIEDRWPNVGGTSTNVPNITQSTPPDQARAELSAAIGRPLPDNFGTVTVFKSDQLAAAQDAVNLFDKLVVAMLIVTLLLLIATIVVAVRRRRAIIALALGAVIALIIANTVINALKDQIVGLVGGAEARAAAKATVTQLVNRLDLITRSLIVLGIVVALIAFLTGNSRPARAIRRESARAGRAVVGSSSGDSVPRGVRWMHDHVAELRWGALALALLLLLFVVSGWVGLAVTLVVLGLFEAGVSYVGTREWPDAAPTPT